MAKIVLDDSVALENIGLSSAGKERFKAKLETVQLPDGRVGQGFMTVYVAPLVKVAKAVAPVKRVKTLDTATGEITDALKAKASILAKRFNVSLEDALLLLA